MIGVSAASLEPISLAADRAGERVCWLHAAPRSSAAPAGTRRCTKLRTAPLRAR